MEEFWIADWGIDYGSKEDEVHVKPMIHVAEHDKGVFMARKVIWDDILCEDLESGDPINFPEVDICEFLHINEGYKK